MGERLSKETDDRTTRHTTRKHNASTTRCGRRHKHSYSFDFTYSTDWRFVCEAL